MEFDNNVANLEVNMKVDNAKRHFSCEICNKTFSQFADLKTLTRTHAGERLYICFLVSGI